MHFDSVHEFHLSHFQFFRALSTTLQREGSMHIGLVIRGGYIKKKKALYKEKFT